MRHKSKIETDRSCANAQLLFFDRDAELIKRQRMDGIGISRRSAGNLNQIPRYGSDGLMEYHKLWEETEKDLAFFKSGLYNAARKEDF